MNTDLKQTVRERLWTPAVELCGAEVTIAGRRKVPDASKAYLEYKVAHAFPSRTAYGTTFHPGTVANSFLSMEDQVFNLGHRMRAYDRSKERNEIPRDFILGTTVGVEFPQRSLWQLSLNAADAPYIRAVAVIHKNAERVPTLLGEHLSGKRKWTVSLEVDYSMAHSGFLVADRKRASAKQEALMAETTPKEVAALSKTEQWPDFGYVTVEQAPEELLDTYDFDKRALTGSWGPSRSGQGLPVTLMKGGINGQVHFMGTGAVHYGAEREAEIQQILASDPERLTEMAEAEQAEWFSGAVELFEKLLR